MILSNFAYLSILIFLAVVIYRILKIAATPVHLRWELYPVPHEGGKKAKYGGSYLEELDWWTKSVHGSKFSELRVMIAEIFLLKGIWEYNRGLWFWSWGFHIGLYGAAVTAFLLIVATITDSASLIGGLALTIGGIICTIGYFLGALGCLGMLVKRTTDAKLKNFTAPAAIFNLLFILAIFVTGIIAMFKASSSVFILQLQQFIAGLITFNSYTPVQSAVSIHIAVALLFMIYMPFTHMAHFIAKYFTYHDVRWNDKPNFKGSALEKKISKNLKYKPTWAAEHLKADGKKNWVDIATEEIGRDEKKA